MAASAPPENVVERVGAAHGGRSLAIAQRSVRDAAVTYPLWPPLTAGCPATSNEEVQYPLEVAYDFAGIDAALFDDPVTPGLGQWAPLLPPLADGVDLGAGGTPLLTTPSLARFAGFDGELYMKDESRNPTWSHKDRLNLCTVSAAVLTGAPGVVVASTGNHGASAAAYAAAAGLPCVVVLAAGGPVDAFRFPGAYGAVLIPVDRDTRWRVVREIVDRLGFHPVSNLTRTHTGHPFGAEGYKTIAFELFLQLGRRTPSQVFVPTGYGEALYGIWKGFLELRRLGLTSSLPRMVACEPAARGPLATALRNGLDAAHVPDSPTDAVSIGCTTSGYRGVVAIRDSGGVAVQVTDEEMYEAMAAQSRAGFWHELSSAAALAGLRQLVAAGDRMDGPVVFVSTSSGFKNGSDGHRPPEPADASWESVRHRLRAGGLDA
jgi:threonine synthase